MYYPRSFLTFILLGFLLVSLPLVYALAELIDEESLRALGIDPRLRPENLGVGEYVAIANSRRVRPESALAAG